jgi:hypothetical protein
VYVLLSLCLFFCFVKKHLSFFVEKPLWKFFSLSSQQKYVCISSRSDYFRVIFNNKRGTKGRSKMFHPWKNKQSEENFFLKRP